MTANHLLENRLVESISSIHAGSREGNGAGRLFDEDLILQKRTVRDTRLECPGHLPRNPETGEPAGGGRCRPPPEELHHPQRIERRRPGILLAVHEYQRAAPALPVDVHAGRGERFGDLREFLIVNDVQTSFPPGQALFNERHRKRGQLAGILIDEDNVISRRNVPESLPPDIGHSKPPFLLGFNLPSHISNAFQVRLHSTTEGFIEGAPAAAKMFARSPPSPINVGTSGSADFRPRRNTGHELR